MSLYKHVNDVSDIPEPNHATFAASTTYTATITLTAKSGYTLQGVSANFFTVAGAASVSNGANSGVVTAVFPATAAPPPIDMVSVPGGSFQMGTASGGNDDEKPVHTVTLTGFSMGKYEVTQAQWKVVMGSLPPLTSAYNYVWGDNYPVYYVSWYDAIVFCNKLSMAEGLSPAYSISNSTNPDDWGTVPTSSNSTWNAAVIVSGSTGYRLPTEAQWEYAAKGGDGSPGNFTYSGSNTVGDVAWYSADNAHLVGTKQANGLGIYDMSGNMSEWCRDWYDDYTSGAQTDPVGLTNRSGRRVVRGGSYFNENASYTRCAYRGSADPFSRVSDRGFRLVRP